MIPVFFFFFSLDFLLNNAYNTMQVGIMLAENQKKYTSYPTFHGIGHIRFKFVLGFYSTLFDKFR